jgi:type IV secretion system protein VirB5
MRKFRLVWSATLLFAALGASPAHAGIPVIDVANLMQAVMDVLNSVEQITNQVTQIENQTQQIQRAQRQIDSMTGSRNLGDVFNNPMLQNYLPPDALDAYNAVADGYDALNGAAKDLRDAEMIYNCMDKQGDARRRCQASFARPYQQKAAMGRALQTSNGRIAQIQQLMRRINTTQDPKEIAELQARITAENAMLLHEMGRAQYMEGVYAADAQADTNRNEEMRMDALNRTGNILDRVPRP